MKKIILALAMMFTITLSASAMSYEQARQQALFLTDKMAYELNLTDDQYEAAYEVNLDYLMGVNSYDDVYGTYWRQRNTDLSYILLDWQYRAFISANYFYRPLYWNAGYWHFGIYARYPRRDYFFFGRPDFYAVYRGHHSWRENGGRSWYHGREFGGPRPGGAPRIGMRDGFNRGDFGRGGSFGNQGRPSSTRTTVTRPSGGSFNNGGGSFGNGTRRQEGVRSNVFGNGNNRSDNGNTRSFGNSNNRSFGGSNRSTENRTFTPRSNNSSSFGGGNRGGSFGSGSRGGSFGGGSSTRSGGGSFGGGSNGGFSGGGHFGGGHR